MVIDHHRVDILAAEVLGYKVCPHHLRILQHQYQHRESMTLVWRGAGKTTVGTIAWDIWQIILERNRRLLIASKTGQNASDFLREIKTQFENNEKLKEIFGNFVGSNRWDNTAIEVAGRTKPFKEPTINTVGLEGAVASKHYDAINADDLVDEENSRTKYQRDKMLDWYYKNLTPTLLPPIPRAQWTSPADMFVGYLNMIGTRYHYEDLYGHLMKASTDGTGGELADDKTLIIPIIDDDGNPIWPEMFGLEKIQSLRTMGIIRFNSQFKCDCEAMKGSIFSYDDCQIMPERKIPHSLIVDTGVDLAIAEGEENDMFAQVTVGRTTNGDTYVLDFEEDQLKFGEQTQAIIARRQNMKARRTGVEANAYQMAQIHNLKDDDPQGTYVPIFTLKDKVTRAWKLSAKLFENGKIFFRKEMRFKPKEGPAKDVEHLIEHIVLFPNHTRKDLFDALDIAVATSEKRKRKERQEPGVM